MITSEQYEGTDNLTEYMLTLLSWPEDDLIPTDIWWAVVPAFIPSLKTGSEANHPRKAIEGRMAHPGPDLGGHLLAGRTPLLCNV